MVERITTDSPMNHEKALILVCSQFISQLEDCADNPDMIMQCPAILNAQTGGTAIGESLRIDMQLPAGAAYSETPPQFPQAGIYCFPSGNFKPASDLGWRLKPNASRLMPRRHVSDQGNRLLYMNCKHPRCEARIKLVVGPFLTTAHVLAMPDNSKHEHD